MNNKNAQIIIAIKSKIFFDNLSPPDKNVIMLDKSKTTPPSIPHTAIIQATKGCDKEG